MARILKGSDFHDKCHSVFYYFHTGGVQLSSQYIEAERI